MQGSKNVKFYFLVKLKIQLWSLPAEQITSPSPSDSVNGAPVIIEVSTRFVTAHQNSNLRQNQRGSVPINVILMRVRATIVTVDKQ